MSISQSAIIADKETEIERLSALANERYILLAARNAEIAALRDLVEACDAQLNLRRLPYFASRLDAARAALEMSGGVK